REAILEHPDFRVEAVRQEEVRLRHRHARLSAGNGTDRDVRTSHAPGHPPDVLVARARGRGLGACRRTGGVGARRGGSRLVHVRVPGQDQLRDAAAQESPDDAGGRLMLRQQLDKLAPLFGKGGKLEKLYPIYEATDTILYTPGEVTRSASHIRDGIDQKRMMILVVVALLPCMVMAMYNTGYQAHLAVANGALPLDDWQTNLFLALGFSAADTTSVLGHFVHGALYYLPVYLVTLIVGGHVEVAFAV